MYAPFSLAQNFASMQLSEIDDNIVSRRNRIFLLMEEVRRLRIQRRLKVPPQGALSGQAGLARPLPSNWSVAVFLQPEQSLTPLCTQNMCRGLLRCAVQQQGGAMLADLRL